MSATLVCVRACVPSFTCLGVREGAGALSSVALRATRATLSRAAFGDMMDVATSPNKLLLFAAHHANIDRSNMIWMARAAKADKTCVGWARRRARWHWRPPAGERHTRPSSSSSSGLCPTQSFSSSLGSRSLLPPLSQTCRAHGMHNNPHPILFYPIQTIQPSRVAGCPQKTGATPPRRTNTPPRPPGCLLNDVINSAAPFTNIFKAPPKAAAGYTHEKDLRLAAPGPKAPYRYA